MDPERRTGHRHDQSVFHRLLDRHAAIQRRVERIEDGIRTVTTSDDPEVAQLIREHVPAMHRRLQEGFPLRRWDPLYVAIFSARDRIRMAIDLLPDGVRVIETSDDPEVVRIIRAHGEAVTAFVRHGHAAARHPAPLPEQA